MYYRFLGNTKYFLVAEPNCRNLVRYNDVPKRKVSYDLKGDYHRYLSRNRVYIGTLFIPSYHLLSLFDINVTTMHDEIQWHIPFIWGEKSCINSDAHTCRMNWNYWNLNIWYFDGTSSEFLDTIPVHKNFNIQGEYI